MFLPDYLLTWPTRNDGLFPMNSNAWCRNSTCLLYCTYVMMARPTTGNILYCTDGTQDLLTGAEASPPPPPGTDSKIFMYRNVRIAPTYLQYCMWQTDIQFMASVIRMGELAFGVHVLRTVRWKILQRFENFFQTSGAVYSCITASQVFQINKGWVHLQQKTTSYSNRMIETAMIIKGIVSREFRSLQMIVTAACLFYNIRFHILYFVVFLI